jgi:hypothetical protein
MRNYNYEDFNLGDGVFHKTNTSLKMIVIKMDDETKVLSCRWINRDGNKLEETFLFAELIKSDDHDRDMAPRVVSMLP